MTLVSLKTLNTSKDGVFKAELDDGSQLLFSIDYFPEEMNPASWEAGQELPAPDEDALRFSAGCYAAEKAALRLIARAEQSSLRLSAKLERKGYKAAELKAVISRLLERGLLNDERYSELWLRSRLSRGKKPSPRRLLASLAGRGVGRNSSRKALETVLSPEAEYALLLEYIEKNGGAGREARTIPRSLLKSEGFSPSVIERFFEQIQ